MAFGSSVERVRGGFAVGFEVCVGEAGDGACSLVVVVVVVDEEEAGLE